MSAFVCDRCGGTSHYNVDGTLSAGCRCCRICDGEGRIDGNDCFPCAGTGQRLAGSEEVTAVERRTSKPVVNRGRR